MIKRWYGADTKRIGIVKRQGSKIDRTCWIDRCGCYVVLEGVGVGCGKTEEGWNS